MKNSQNEQKKQKQKANTECSNSDFRIWWDSISHFTHVNDQKLSTNFPIQ